MNHSALMTKLTRWLTPDTKDVFQNTSIFSGYEHYHLITHNIHERINDKKTFFKSVATLNFSSLLFYPFINYCITLPFTLVKTLITLLLTPLFIAKKEYSLYREILVGNILLTLNSILLPTYQAIVCLLFDCINIPARLWATYNHAADYRPDDLNDDNDDIITVPATEMSSEATLDDDKELKRNAEIEMELERAPSKP